MAMEKDNPEWGTAERRRDMNHLMARLIFCFFAGDTGIFNGTILFTATIEQMGARDSSNAREVISELFRAMNTPQFERTGFVSSNGIVAMISTCAGTVRSLVR
jgi:hypothetical protein